MPETEYLAVAAAEAAKNGHELIRRAQDGLRVLARRDRGLNLKIEPSVLG